MWCVESSASTAVIAPAALAKGYLAWSGTSAVCVGGTAPTRTDASRMISNCSPAVVNHGVSRTRVYHTWLGFCLFTFTLDISEG